MPSNVNPHLVPGLGFHLEGDGFWDVQEIPKNVLETAEFFGNLDIEGYQAVVFQTPNGDQWAQKAPGTPSPKGDEAKEQIMSFSFDRIATRMAKVNLDPSLQNSLKDLSIELENAEIALSRAVQFGRRLEVEPSFDWITQHTENVLNELKEFRKGAQDAIEYALPEGSR